ncbi:hypothetical protein GT93_11285 [Pseudomonas plecoglossicida]|nr:hypothetical protein GT93_11285 [Pseudomonas plecoglossicida]
MQIARRLILKPFKLGILFIRKLTLLIEQEIRDGIYKHRIACQIQMIDTRNYSEMSILQRS